MPTEVDVGVHVTVLGSVGVRRDATDAELGTRLRRLLAGLTVSNGSVVSTDRLVEIVWAGDPPDGAEKTLRSYVTRLRRALDVDEQRDEQRIVFREPGYVIDLQTSELDSASFEEEVDEALRLLRAADASAAGRLLEVAIARWRGPAFAGFADEEWARPESVRLEERLIEAREALIETRLAERMHEEAVAEAQALAEAEPLRERPRALLMRAMYAAGRQAEALRVFASYRRYLAEETGLDPSAEIVDLERRIARGDASLAGDVRPLRGYELGDRIGEGAFAVVHRAVQPGVERDVAIKIIRAELADQPDFIRRFEFEARTVARIEHPNVVPLIDFWREPGAAYLVMRLLRGGSVEQRLRSGGPYSREQTMRLLNDVGGALETAHRAGVVHRDVRPANLLLDADGTTYLADFGIALPTAAIDDLPIRSPAYAAPEVLRGEPAGAAADILSLGVTTFEVLTGRLPFADSTDHGDLVQRQLSEPLPPVRATRTDLPAVVDDVIARATAKAPDDRYATVAAFVGDLRAALDVGPQASEVAAIRWRTPVENPYVGLHAFDEADEDRFFGREGLVTELIHALERHRFVAVVGPSGSGKSSVVRAGLLPAIRRGALPHSESWFVATMLPGADPVDALETALLRVAVNPPATLREQLAEPGGLLRAVRRVLPDERAQILLVVDQFEELFTQSRHPDERDRFLAELAEAATHPDSPLRIVATLRADHYDVPLQHATVAELVTRGTVTVRPMTAGELERAISRPAASVGVHVEPTLVSELVAGITARPAALPLLQFSLTELFERRVADTMLLSTHRELGGLTGALAARAERVLDAGGADDEAEARRIFGRLVAFGEGSDDTRRRALRSEFGDGERTAWLLDAFVTARLLSTDRDPATREPTVEVAHEALLREWPRLSGWLQEDRALRRSVGAIGVAATVWDEGGRQAADLYRGGRLEAALEVAAADPEWLRPLDHEFLEASSSQEEANREAERRRVRRLRRLVVGTAAALVVALVAGGVALTQQRRADREAQAAEARAEEADEQRQEADAQRQAAVEQRQAADAATTDAELNELIARSAAAAPTDSEEALLLALEAYQRDGGAATLSALLDTIVGGGLGQQIGLIQRLPQGDCANLVEERRLSTDGLWEFSSDGDQLLRKDLVTGEVTNHGTAPVQCAGWWQDAQTGTRWVTTGSLAQHWIGSPDEPWRLVDRPDSGGSLVAEPVHGRFLFGQGDQGGAEAVVVDAENLEAVGPAAIDLDFDLFDTFVGRLPAAAGSEAAGLFAVARARPSVAAGGLAVVLDAATGTEVFGVERPDPVTAIAFAPDGRTLFVGEADGTVATIDVASGDVIAEMATIESVEIVALGARSDDVIVAVGRSSIELFDPSGRRQSGPFDIPATEDARVRPDGSVAIVPIADPDNLRIVDPNRGPLVESGRSVDPTALVGFGHGRAVAVDPSGDVEVVELASDDDWEAIELRTGDDRVFRPVGVVPEPDGYLAWDDGSLVARWRAGEIVEQLELWPDPVTNVSLTRKRRNTSGRPGIGDVEAVGAFGGGFAGAGAAVVFEYEAPKAVYAFDPTPGNLAMDTTLGTPPFGAAAVTRGVDGELLVAMIGGTVRTYDRAGNRVGEIDTGLIGASVVVADPATRSIAIGGPNGAVLVDPDTATVRSVADGAVVSLGFARDGAVLVVVDADGTVRLWDTTRGESIGTLWTGSGTAPPSPPWYDESTDTVWVATSGRILQFSLDPERWVERVCQLVARELTSDEWDRLVPGDTEPRPACS
jgi:DNA-binding SARP family transcriptional activator